MKEGWEYKKLGEVCTLLTDGDWVESKDQSESGIRLIQTGNIGNGFYKDKTESSKYISEETFSKLNCTEIFEGDILISRLPDPIGRACIIPNNSTRMITAVDCSIIRLNDTILPELLVYYTMSNPYKDKILRAATGTTRKRISRKNLSKILIPIPPISEQQHIVEELDLLSSIIEKKKAQLKELDNLAQSIFYEMFSNINDHVPISNYIESVGGGKSLAGNEECENKVLKTGAVTYDHFNGAEVKNLPIDYIPQQEHLLNDGDILVSRMNTLEYVGACAYVWKAPKNTYLPDRLWRVKPKENINSIYLWFSLIQSESKEQIRAMASGTSGTMKNISRPRFLSVKIKNSPLDLQELFASKIQSIEHQKALIKQSITEVETLFNSRMDYYFN